MDRFTDMFAAGVCEMCSVTYAERTGNAAVRIVEDAWCKQIMNVYQSVVEKIDEKSSKDTCPYNIRWNHTMSSSSVDVAER